MNDVARRPSAAGVVRLPDRRAAARGPRRPRARRAWATSTATGAPTWSFSLVRVQRATVYVVFGKRSTAPVDLRRVGRRGFAIRRQPRQRDVGDAISGAGDFNGDGLADIAVGAPQSDAGGRYGAGSTFVVFGEPARRAGRRSGPARPPRGPDRRRARVRELGRIARAVGRRQRRRPRRPAHRGVAGLGAGRAYAGAAYVVFGQATRAGSTCSGRARPAYRILGRGRPVARRARASRWRRSATSTATAAAT